MLSASSGAQHAVPPVLHCLWQPATQRHAQHCGQLLGSVRYGNTTPCRTDDGLPADLHLPMCTDGQPEWHEHWYSATSVHPLRLQEAPMLHGRHNDDVLWGCFSLPMPEGDNAWAPAVQDAYLQLLHALQTTGFVHLWRIWNFIPRINASNAQALENYRDFNLGRAQAFAQAYDQGRADMPDAVRHMPAATGIGCLGEQLHVYFLAGRTPGRHIENPRQIAAYHYPPEHGPRPPCFARASAVTLQDQHMLFVSGTASIIGHQTVHAHDVGQQCHTALDNMAIVAAQAGLALEALPLLKVYVRHARHLPQVQAICQQRLAQHAHTAFFVVDICRSDLLVEVEAMCL